MAPDVLSRRCLRADADGHQLVERAGLILFRRCYPRTQYPFVHRTESCVCDADCGGSFGITYGTVTLRDISQIRTGGGVSRWDRPITKEVGQPAEVN